MEPGCALPDFQNMIAAKMSYLKADSSSGSTPWTCTAPANTDNSWTMPADAEILEWFDQLYADDTFNGYKPFHLTMMNDNIRDGGFKNTADQKIHLPTVKDFVTQYLWGSLPKAVQEKIKTWATNYTKAKGNMIAHAIYEPVRTLLSGPSFLVPSLIIRATIGFLVPKIVAYIVANINTLTVKDN